MKRATHRIEVRIVLTFLLLLSAVAFADDAAKSVAKRVDQHYNSLRSMRMDFTETLDGAGLHKNESGVLELKKPGRMRWDYTQPQPKLFVSDGKTAYFYTPGERQARKAPVKKLDDLHSPLRYLLGKSKLEDEFDDLKREGNVLSGVPKHMKDRLARVWLTINSQDQIEHIAIEEVDGTRTEFTFSNITENVPLTDARFKFAPPDGVEMVSVEDLQP
jgi:outer membrane lipoprotein carrier protein